LAAVILAFAGLVVVYDAVASALALATGWPYGALALGGLAIQGLAGFVAGRRGGFLWAMIAGGTVAFAEATLGLGASWLVGPGRLHLPSEVGYLVAVGRSVLGGIALGGAGGALTLGWSVEPESGGRRAPWWGFGWLRVDRALAVVLLERGFGLWLGLRLVFALLAGAGYSITDGQGGAPFAVGVVTPDLRVVELLVVLAFADLARRREFVLLGDLGIGAFRATALYVLPGALLEPALLLVPR
jgi:hypothetical protein